MSDRNLLFWILSSFASVLIIFIAVPMGLNDPTHVDHEMGQFFGYIGFAVLIMSAFFGLWAIAIYEPNKIRSEDYHDYIDAMGLDDLSPRDRLMKIKLLIRQVVKDVDTTDLDNTHDTYLKLADLLYEVDALYRSK